MWLLHGNVSSLDPNKPNWLTHVLCNNPASLCFLGRLEGADPASVQSGSRTLTPVESPEDPRLHTDDEDYSGEASGSTENTKHL